MSQLKTVIVTGAANGIGAATALEFASRGYSVALLDRDAAALEATTRAAAQTGAATVSHEGNLSDLSFCESAVRATAERWGRIDVLVNCAAWREVATMRTISMESWEQTVRICLTAPAFLARWAAAHMERQKAGVIVNVSSVMSQMASGLSPAYVACKGALDALTYELAALYAPAGIRVVAVNPGAIDTEMSRGANEETNSAKDATRAFSEDIIMLRRWGTPEEIAKVIAWIAGPDASYLTGTSIVADGGWLRQHLPYSIKHQRLPDQFP